MAKRAARGRVFEAREAVMQQKVLVSLRGKENKQTFNILIGQTAANEVDSFSAFPYRGGGGGLSEWGGAVLPVSTT